MWKFLLPFAAFVALVVLFVFGLNPNRDIHALPSPLIGKAAPEFALADVLDPSRVVSNAALKGQVYVVNVWGTWCIECRVEHEELLAISRQHVVPMIGIDWSVDHGPDERERAKLWLTQLGNPYTAVAFRPGRPYRHRLWSLRRAGNFLSRPSRANHFQVHFAHDAGGVGKGISATHCGCREGRMSRFAHCCWMLWCLSARRPVGPKCFR